MRRCDRTDGIFIKDCLTTRRRAITDLTVKESLTVKAGLNRPAVTEESSVAQLRAIQWCEVLSYVIGKTGSATP